MNGKYTYLKLEEGGKMDVKKSENQMFGLNKLLASLFREPRSRGFPFYLLENKKESGAGMEATFRIYTVYAVI